MIIYRSFIKVLLILILITFSYRLAQSQEQNDTTQVEQLNAPPPPDDGGGGGDGGGNDGGGGDGGCDAPANPKFTVSTNTCGNKVLTVTNPEQYVQYFWDIIGKSTSMTYVGNTHTVDSSNVYYVRARSYGGCWSTHSWSESVTVQSTPGIPDAPGLEGCNNDILRRGTPPTGVVWYWQGKNENGYSMDDSNSTYRALSTGTYYLRSRSTAGCWGASVSKYVVVDPQPGEVSVSGTKRFGEGYLNLTASTPNAVSYNWYTSATAINPVASVSKSWKDIFTQSKTYYVAGVHDKGCEGPRTAVQVSVYTRPKVVPVGNAILDLAQTTVTLTTNLSYDSYQWFDQYGAIEGEVSKNLEVTRAGHYAVKVTKAGVSGYDISDYYLVRHALEKENRSYKHTVTIKKEGVKHEAEVRDLPASDKIESLVFYDGMGRAEQAIHYGESGNHIIKTREYDETGRETTTWLPYVTDTKPDKFVTDWKTKVQQYYQTEVDYSSQTNSPFAKRKIDDSPRGLLRESGFAGDAWQPGTGNTMAYQYTFIDGSEAFYRFTVNEGLLIANTYGPGELQKTTVSDEDGHNRFSFVDAEGRTILTRSQATEGTGAWADTYYVYDTYGNLRYVLPPEAVKEIGNPTLPFTVSQDLLDRWAFQHEYDHRDRMVGKKDPGTAWVHMVYDERDRLALTQDGNQRLKGEWLFNKYDALNRLVATGIYQDGADRVAMQDKLDRYYNQEIIWTQFQGAEVVDGLLTSTAANGWGNSGASTGVVLQDDQDGTIHFETKYVNDRYMIGFSDADVNAHYNTIDYAVYINQSVFYVYESGVKKWHTGYLDPGDVFQIERKGNEIRYKRNGNIFHITPNVQTGPLVVDAAIYSLGDVIKMASPRYYETKSSGHFDYSDLTFPQVKDDNSFLSVTYYDNYDFHHATLPDYAFIPDKDHSTYFNRVKGLVTGTKTRILGEERWISTVNYYDDKYRVIQTVSNNHKEGTERMTSTYDFVGKVLESKLTHFQPMKVIWKNLRNVTATSTMLTSNTTANWSAGASSANTLAANEDGWFETTVLETNTNKFIGFNEWDDSHSYWDIDYSVYFYGKSLRAYRNGSSLGAKGTINAGDRVRMERVNGEVRVLVNNNLVYTFEGQSTTPLSIDAALSFAPASLGYVTCSFGTPDAQAPYPVLWTGMKGVYSRPDSLVKPGASGWTNAGASSINKLKASEDGWASFKAASSTEKLMFGLSDKDESLTYHTIDYAIYLYEDSRILIYENGGHRGWFHNYQEGDIFKVERINGIINYLHNDQVFYTSGVPSETELIVDVSIHATNSTVLEARTSFDYASPTESQTDITRSFDYDHAERLLKTYHALSEGVQWTDLENVGVNQNYELYWKGEEGPHRATSKQVILSGEDGGVTYRYHQSGGKRICLNWPGNSSEGACIVYYNGSSRPLIRVNGAFKKWLSSSSGTSSYSIKREQGKLKFYDHESVTLEMDFEQARDLYVQGTLIEQGKTIKNVMIDYGTKLLAENHYNELGELIEKNLHSEDEGNTFAQSVDYRYNIRGWLTRINGAKLHNDGTEPQDYFGIEFYHDRVENNLQNTPAYNGNISAVKWGSHLGLGDLDESAYTYSYDGMNRLKSAWYHKRHNSSWGSAGDYDVAGIQYDLNGNILRLTRFADVGGREKIDELVYNYGQGTSAHSNQLIKVKDDSNSSFSGEGFKDTIGDDYLYDSNGNMTYDNNKDISTITYNHLDLPERITKGSGEYTRYIYTAGGVKLAREEYNASGQLKKRTDYIGGFIYENDTLRYIHHEQGRVVANAARGYEYQYFIRDHLGNTRVVFTTRPKTIEFAARFESETAIDEESVYGNLSETRVQFNSADATASDIHVSGDNEVVQLNNSQPTGPALSLPVYPGDELDMEVYGYFEGGSGYSTTQAATVLVSSIAGAFGGVNGGNTYEQATYDAFNTAHSNNMLLSGTSSDTRPAAYLNYIMFDRNMKPYKHGHAQITSQSFYHRRISLEGVVAEKSGFVYIYLSNESDSPLPVFFDDMKITLREHPVVQMNDYYPFGLQHNTSWTRPTSLKNNYLFNGGSELNEDLGIYELPLRHYDPATGRMTGVDPYASSYLDESPYSYAGANPIYYSDPSGGSYADLSRDDVFVNGGYQVFNSLGNMGYTGPGSGQHWSDFHRSVEGNAMLMSSSAFNGFYGINNGNRFDFARAISSAPTVADRRQIGNFLGGELASDGTFYQVAGVTGARNHGEDITGRLEVLPQNIKLDVAAFNPLNPSLFSRFNQAPEESGHNWRNVAAAQASIFGGAASIVVKNSRPLYTGVTEWAGTVKGATKFSNRMGYVGLAFTAYDMYDNGLTISNGLDATFGVIGFMGPIGAAVSGVYFVSNMITVGMTGESIGEHIDNNFMFLPGPAGFIPIPKGN
ncbi:hypothetical protein C900_00507 [Fulvivirga imtechensis AK7]|uniref:Uncharacterized protein n=1 Tax=Fulvivirga imtechensis AK7 TaxID=1237149 RepID=L8JW26_9BACT|nr:RHS repeat-associated core domain-containing protein [Fulvivirga imtechensis]ELR73005.1 hypothetical protein C900_00507 [Fulvivirga imtechensis AK7]